MPARLKGLLDRTLLSGFAFQYVKGKAQPLRLLAGKTARLLLTMDSPVWYYRWWLGDPPRGSSTSRYWGCAASG